MKLMYASLIRASQTWRGVLISEFERKHLETLREELNAQFEKHDATPIQPASRSRNYSKQGLYPEACSRALGFVTLAETWRDLTTASLGRAETRGG